MERETEEKILLLYNLDDFEENIKDDKIALKAYQMGLEMVERTLKKYFDVIYVTKEMKAAEFKRYVGKDLISISKLIDNLKKIENEEI